MVEDDAFFQGLSTYTYREKTRSIICMNGFKSMCKKTKQKKKHLGTCGKLIVMGLYT